MTIAKKLIVGQRIQNENGDWVRIERTKETKGFRVNLEGHPEAFAIMTEWKDGYKLFHPEEEVPAA